MDGKGPSGRGKLTERLEVEFGPFPPCCIALSRMLFAYIHRSITHRVHFLDKACPGPLPFKGQSITAKPLRYAAPCGLANQHQLVG